MQISKLEWKPIQLKVGSREGLLKVTLKAASYYGTMESPSGLLLHIGTCLNPYCKLNLFRECDVDARGETEYEKSYKKEFILYYDLYYAPINHQAPEMSIPQSGLNRRSKHPDTSRHRGVIQSEALGYLKTDSEIKPPNADAVATDRTRKVCPSIHYTAGQGGLSVRRPRPYTGPGGYVSGNPHPAPVSGRPPPMP